jgi:hypothetical protein
MDKYTEEEAQTQNLMEQLPVSTEMPPHVRSKAMTIAIEANRKARAARRPRTVAWLTAGVAGLALASMFLVPKPAKAWSLVKQAVDKVTSVQLRMKISDTNGKMQDTLIAMKKDQMMVDTGEGFKMYMDREGMQFYNAEENTIVKMNLPPEAKGFMPDIASEMIKTFNLKEEMAKMEKEYGKDHIRIMPIRTENGRRVYDVIMTAPEGPEKCFMTVDAQTDLPIYIDADGGDGKDNSSMKISLRYNDDFEITPNFPKGAKIQTVDMSDMEKQGKEIENAFKSFGPKVD